MNQQGLRTAAVLAAVAAGVLTGNAAPTGSTILFGATHGGAGDGSASAPVALGTGTAVVAVAGPDGNFQTADDELLLIQGIGGGDPSITALALPGCSDFSGHVLRLSATRVAVFGAGADLNWETEDDVVRIVDGLGSSNSVTTLVVGPLRDTDASAPTALSSETLVLHSYGVDAAGNTADDEVVLVTFRNGVSSIAHLPAPYLPKTGRSRPVALSPDSFLVPGNGPDATEDTADDVVHLFTDVLGTPLRTDLPVPFLFVSSPSRPVRVSATRAVVGACGPDAILGTEDDVLWLLDDLGGTNVLTSITTGSHYNYGAALPTVLTESLVVTTTNGPDGIDKTADDGVVVISGLGTTNTVTTVVLASIDEDGQARPVRLGTDSCLVVTAGLDGVVETADDDVVLLSGVGTTNALIRIPIPGLLGGATSTPVALSPDSFLVTTRGPDGVAGGGDDRVVLVTDALGTPVLESVGFDAGGEVTGAYALPYVPVVLGNGVAIHVTSGADGELFTTDDGLRVLTDVPEVRGLFVRSAKLGFQEAKPEKGEKVVLKASLSLADDAGITDDVTLTLGNSSETVPAGAFTAKKGTWKYRAPKGGSGFVKSVVYSQKKGTLVVKSKGVDTGAETTDPDHVAFGFESGSTFLAAVVEGVGFKGGIKFKAPK